MRGLTRVSGVIYDQTLNVLATNANNTSNSHGPRMQMMIIIGVFLSALLFMLCFYYYARICRSSDNDANANPAHQSRSDHLASEGPGQGRLDKVVVDNLPLVGYSLVKGHKGEKEMSECAVCLSDFQDDEDLRLLPKCGHVFHPGCIDMWLDSHSTCPLCRGSLVPTSASAKQEDAANSEGFQNWVNSRAVGPDGETFTTHNGPPVPPNSTILELLSREGPYRILPESLRRDGERLDTGLARREGDQNGERAVEIRALIRALSRNSPSLGVQVNDRTGAATGSARFNPPNIAGAVDANGVGSAFFEKRDRKSVRSAGSSHSFNMALRRSNSIGSSGRYLRQLFGDYTDDFSPDSEQDGLRVHETKLLGTEHRLPVGHLIVKRQRSETELQNPGRIGIPVWENIDMNEERGKVGTTAGPSPAFNNRSGGDLPPWASRETAGRKYQSVELPLSAGVQPLDVLEEASGPLHVSGKGMDSVEERTESDRWAFGQSLRKSEFSSRRTFSDTWNGVVGSISQQTNEQQPKWYSQMMPAAPSFASKRRKITSPWAGAMKIRRFRSSEEASPTPNSQSVPVSDQQPHELQQLQSPQHQESIQLVIQP